MRFRASAVAAAVGGAVVGPDVDVDGARHDSRDVVGGELFVPVRGERDGHDFIAAAVDRGAAAYLTAREPSPDVPATAIRVAAPEAALTALGSAARGRLPDRVIGVTGSVGKTSTKDLAASALRETFATAASLRSFNNELGVPLTLVNAPDGTEVVVVEMGARGRGHIASLCDVARPTIAVVTTVVSMHTEMFGSIDQVAVAKRELVEAVPSHGTVVLNAANELVAAMAGHAAGAVLTFGTTSSDLRADAVVLDAELRPRFTLRSPWGDADVELEVRGKHNVVNALAAAGAALAAGAPLDAVARGLGAGTLSPWRMELSTAPSGARILNDAYNAGPASMAAALDALDALPVERRTAVVGYMAELGDQEASAHREVVERAAAAGLRLIAIDAPAYEGSTVEHVADIDGAAKLLGALDAGDAVLIKGSRVAGLERLAAALLS